MPELSETQRVYAYFWVENFSSSNDVTLALGIEPTRIFTRQNGTEVWQLHTDESTDRLDAHISQLITLLTPVKKQIIQLPAQYKVGVNGVGYFYGSNPGFGLSKNQLAFFSDLAVDMDFDLYNYSIQDQKL